MNETTPSESAESRGEVPEQQLMRLQLTVKGEYDVAPLVAAVMLRLAF